MPSLLHYQNLGCSMIQVLPDVHKSDMKSTSESSLFSHKTKQFLFPFPEFNLKNQNTKETKSYTNDVAEP